jgi:hypothetical protein
VPPPRFCRHDDNASGIHAATERSRTGSIPSTPWKFMGEAYVVARTSTEVVPSTAFRPTTDDRRPTTDD